MRVPAGSILQIGSAWKAALLFWLSLFLLAACGRNADPRAEAPASSRKERATPTTAAAVPMSAKARGESASRAAGVNEQPQVAGTNLPIYELRIGRDDLRRLEQSAFSNQTVPATFIADGVT